MNRIIKNHLKINILLFLILSAKSNIDLLINSLSILKQNGPFEFPYF